MANTRVAAAMVRCMKWDVLVGASLDARCSVHLLQHDPRQLRAEPDLPREWATPFHSCGTQRDATGREAQERPVARPRRSAGKAQWASLRARRSGTRRAPGPGPRPACPAVAEEGFDVRLQMVVGACGGAALVRTWVRPQRGVREGR